MLTFSRDQWLNYRWQRHGLGGELDDDRLDDLLALGVQDGRQAGAALSLRQRAASAVLSPRQPPTGDAAREWIGPDGPFVSLWTVRGAPHVHRVTHLDFIRDALAPDPADEGGAGYVAAVDEVATALRATVRGATSKADASSAVAGQVSGSLVAWCDRCQARHVPDGLFRAAGLRAQVVLGPEQRATMLHPKPRQRQRRVAHPRLALLRAYLRVNGPTTRTLFRDWLGGVAATAATWSELADRMVKARVEQKRAELPEELVEEVRTAPRATGVVLVPPNDPYLRQVDRTLLVPDSKRRQEVWRALSGPGALLVDGEVAGTWRYRGSERTLTINAFSDLTPARRRSAERNAGLVAEVSGGGPPRVDWS
ncbi:DNA glycosylase AlkZ-like family protein [Plantactinospora sp. GCM10030261]|uniref:DNA glycosylase AlkZ-like family protein n=1 Tax=Plantactinospora sp. GCM10030261 TaxID=3273420 RepID=UPI00360A774A